VVLQIISSDRKVSKLLFMKKYNIAQYNIILFEMTASVYKTQTIEATINHRHQRMNSTRSFLSAYWRHANSVKKRSLIMRQRFPTQRFTVRRGILGSAWRMLQYSFCSYITYSLRKFTNYVTQSEN